MNLLGTNSSTLVPHEGGHRKKPGILRSLVLSLITGRLNQWSFFLEGVSDDPYGQKAKIFWRMLAFLFPQKDLFLGLYGAREGTLLWLYLEDTSIVDGKKHIFYGKHLLVTPCPSSLLTTYQGWKHSPSLQALLVKGGAMPDTCLHMMYACMINRAISRESQQVFQSRFPCYRPSPVQGVQSLCFWR